MSHTAVIFFKLDEVDELEPEQVALCLAKDLLGEGYDCFVMDILENYGDDPWVEGKKP